MNKQIIEELKNSCN